MFIVAVEKAAHVRTQKLPKDPRNMALSLTGPIVMIFRIELCCSEDEDEDRHPSRRQKGSQIVGEADDGRAGRIKGTDRDKHSK